MKVLLSAFSCEPERGSEPEVGFQAMLAAAEQHEVWLLTSATGVPALERFLASRPPRGRIHLVPYPAVPHGQDEGDLGLVAFHRMYDAWQRAVTPLAVDLDRRINFDLVHHVTIATVWTRAGVAAVDKPLVWGPVGGGVHPPVALASELGLRGAAEDLARFLARRALASLPHARAAPRRAALVLAQNSLSARVICTPAPVTILSNSTVVDVRHVTTPRRRTRDLAVVGRLLPWKGTLLALRAFRHVPHREARLRFFGAGPDLERLQRAARRWGLQDRVRFEGRVPRDRMLGELAASAALVHPSLHDEAGLSVAEALSLGVPAICLDHGGPAEVVRQWPAGSGHLIPPGRPQPTARHLAAAMSRCLDEPAPLVAAPLPAERSFRHRVQEAYAAAVSAHPARAMGPEADDTPSPPGAAAP